MDELALKAKELIEKLESASPYIADQVLWIIRLQNIAELVGFAVAILVFCGIPWYILRRVWQPYLVQQHKKRYGEQQPTDFNWWDLHDAEGWCVAYGISWAPWFFILGVLDFWRWVGVFYPELYLARVVINSVL